MAAIDRCVHCGEYVPEGRFVCYNCENTRENSENNDNENVEKKREMSMFTIYSQRLAGYLMQQGFALIAMVKNEGTHYNNFLFANTEELHNSIAEWQKLKT